MGVYIKGMEMPKSCGNCYMFSFLSDSCRITNHVTEEMNDKMFDRRFDDCPLVPVPPHGRLIDGDAFEEFIRKDWDKNDHWIAEVVYSRPTIIPAEETIKEATND